MIAKTDRCALVAALGPALTTLRLARFVARPVMWLAARAVMWLAARPVMWLAALGTVLRPALGTTLARRTFAPRLRTMI